MSKFKVTVSTDRDNLRDEVSATYSSLKGALGAAMMANLAAGLSMGNHRWWEGGWDNCYKKTWENSLKTIRIEVVRLPG